MTNQIRNSEFEIRNEDRPAPSEMAGLGGGWAVRAVGLGKSIEERGILRGIDLEIKEGEFVALLGANGAGKSTLLKVLAGLTHATAGRVELFGGGEDTGGQGRPLKSEARVRGRVGLIGHQTMLYHDLSAIENLEFFGRLYGVKRARERGMGLLERLGLGNRALDQVKGFSRGMAQRVAIARALMHDPELLLADEPFAGLDAPSTAMLERVLAELHAAGKTIVLANHDIRQSLRLAGEAAGRAVMLVRGEKVIDERAAGLEAGEVLGRMEGGKFESRMTNDESNPNSEIRNPKLQMENTKHETRKPPEGGTTSVVGQVRALVGKDLRIEGRTRQTMGLVVVLGILIVTVLGLGLGQMSRETVTSFTPAILWVAYLFAGVLCFEKTMAVERQDGALAGLLLAPLDRGAIYAAKLISNLILMFGAAAVITGAGLLFFGFDLSPAPWGFVLVIAVSMIGFAAIGTLFAALVSSTRLQGGLLAMVIFPVILPLVIASTQQVTVMFRDGAAPALLGPEGTINGLGILLAFDAIFLVASWLMFEMILEP